MNKAPIFEPTLTCGLYASVHIGEHVVSSIFEGIRQYDPSARRLTGLKAVILGHNEVSKAQEVANKGGLPFYENALNLISKTLRRHTPSESTAQSFSIARPLIVPNPSDVSDQNHYVAYRLALFGNAPPPAYLRMRGLIRGRMVEIADPQSKDRQSLQEACGRKDVLLPIAVTNNPDSIERNHVLLHGKHLASNVIALHGIRLYGEMREPSFAEGRDIG